MEIRERYARDGIVFPLVALTTAEVEHYREAVEEHLGRPDAELRRLHLNHDWARELATHPGVVTAAEELLGGEVDVWGTLVVRKDPRSDDYVAWHQDGAYAAFDGGNALSAWIALRESTMDSGCMRASQFQFIPERGDAVIMVWNLKGKGVDLWPTAADLLSECLGVARPKDQR